MTPNVELTGAARLYCAASALSAMLGFSFVLLSTAAVIGKSMSHFVKLDFAATLSTAIPSDFSNSNKYPDNRP